jgi:hypothetical protein
VLATAIALCSLVLYAPPAAAAPARAGLISAAGHVRVVSLGSQPGHPAAGPRTVYPRRSLDPAAERAAKQRAAQGLQAGAPTTVAAPLAGVFNNLNQPGFSASDEGWCCVPPDPTGAIGPSHYVEMVNNLIGVYSRSNLGLLSSMDSAAFTAAPAGLTISDPQIEWDFQGNRWFYLAVAFSSDFLNNYLVFGWSKTADPSDLNAGWCRFGIPAGSGLNDFPKLGHDNNFLFFGSNLYDGSNSKLPFVTADIFAVFKPSSGDASCTGPSAYHFADATHLLRNADGSLADTPVPANTLYASQTGYIVAAHSPLTLPAGPRAKVMVWHMTLQGGVPVLVADGDIAVGSFDVPADVPQPGAPLDTLDGQLTQAVAQRDPDAGGAEAIWTQHTVAGAGGRSALRWYELLPAGLAARQQGQIDSTTDFVFNGAISPSVSGNDAVADYNRASAGLTPVIGARSRVGSTPLGTMDPGELALGTSTDVDQDISCSAPYGPPCRWGDYAGATPDPVNPGVVWGSNMVTGPWFLGFPQWTTRNFAVATGAAAADFTLSAAPASQSVTAGAGAAYTVTVNPLGGFGGQVSLGVSGLPTGAAGTFSPNPTTTNSNLAVTTDPSTPAGTYPLTITGTSGSLTRTTSITLVVTAASGPDFSLSASPASGTVGQGVSATSYSVTVNPINGFSSPVSLAVSGLPAGASATFDVNPTTTTSNLSVGIDSTAPAGSYLLTITGAAGGLTRSTTVTLVVAGDFALSAAPASRTVGQGVNATSYSLTISPINGFSSSVNLGVAGLPVGAAASFSPNPATTASTLNVTIDSTTPVGTYVLTITGSSGGLSHSTTVSLVVNADFAISVSPASQSVTGQGTATYTVGVTPLNGFSGTVSLAVSGVPAGASAAFNPNPTSTSSTLTVSVGPSTPAGSYTLTVTGTAGLSHSTTVTLVVNADFTLSAAPATITVPAGGKGSDVVTIQPLNGFSGSVTLSLSGQPAKSVVSFTPNPATTSSTLSLKLNPRTAAGTYMLTITGTSGGLTHSTTVFLVVN